MFPHTSVLFYLVQRERYVVDDFSYVTNLELKKKGGYNLINNFDNLYLTMVKKLLKESYITKATYKKIEIRNYKITLQVGIR